MTARLVWTVADHWQVFDGWAAARNVEPLTLPLHRFLSLIYYWLVKDADDKGVAKLDRDLWRPPTGVKPPPGSPWSPEVELAGFDALAAQLGITPT